MFENLDLVRHAAKKQSFVALQKILVQAREILAEKVTDGRQQPVEIFFGNRDPEVNVLREAMISVMVYGVTAHEQIFNPGAVLARQKLAEFGGKGMKSEFYFTIRRLTYFSMLVFYLTFL